MAKDKGVNLAKGAATVALTAGVIAAGVVLSDKRNRTKLKKNAKKAAKTLKRVSDEYMGESGDIGDRFQAVAHRVNRRSMKATKKTTKRSSHKK